MKITVLRYYHDWEVPVFFRPTGFPLLDITIHGMPHKRQHRAVIQECREELLRKGQILWVSLTGVSDLPINWPLSLRVLFTNPNTPDLDHLLEALYMAMDAKSLSGPSLLEDDRWIQDVFIRKIYSTPPTRRDGAR